MLVASGPGRRKARGFTLIELVTTITVAGVLLGMALPMFREFVANQRVRNVSFDLMAALTLTRYEAVIRGVPISLARTGASWDQGWTVSDGSVNAIPIQTQEAYKNLAVTDSAGLSVVSFGKDGRTLTTSTRITVAPSPPVAGVTSRCINIGLSGLPSSSVGAC